MSYIQTINPTTGLVLSQYKIQSSNSIDKHINASNQAFVSWKKQDLSHRLHALTRFKKILEHHKQDCAQLMALEMGKPIQDGIAEIEKCILVCDYYLSHAEIFLAPAVLATEFHKSYVAHHPLGIVFAIMPWNFPFWQVLRAAIPILLTGNVMLLKHARNVTGSALKLEQLFLEADYPENVFKTLVISTTDVPKIIEHPYVRGITLTGSEQVGKEVASLAGQHIKKVVLELGGNDPAIVLKDADLSMTAQALVNSRLRNSGQVCVSSKRILVDSSIHDEFIELLLKEIKQFIVGDPLDAKTMMGPMAREDLRASIHQQVHTLIKQGGQCVIGGEQVQGPGFFYLPTLITKVKKDSIAFSEEFFGPVLSVTTFQTEQEAIELANATHFGLGASIFSKDLDKAQFMADHMIDSGLCYVNMPVRSDPRFPFGGIKNSGFGRELSKEGLLEFTNTKTVIVNAN